MGFCWCTGKDDQHCSSTLDLVAAEASFRVVVGTLLASVVDQDSRPSAVVAFRTEVAGHIVAVVASFLAIGIHPSFVEASRILVVHIAMVASVDRNQVVATSLAVGSPSVVGHILVAASSVVNPSFQVVDRTWVTEVDSLVATFPSLVIAYLAFPFVEEAYRPS